ncbi:hypothetical protein P692DRAFT_201803107 [Suillus brevipes Sb2]|nr:hypothetical protein P692DRAFT_201803107 [Suillus brevipes Sb2]
MSVTTNKIHNFHVWYLLFLLLLPITIAIASLACITVLAGLLTPVIMFSDVKCASRGKVLKSGMKKTRHALRSLQNMMREESALAQATSTPGPTYGHHSSYPSPPKPTFNPPPNSSYIMISPPTASPDMPSPSYSTSTSPASTATPPTPPVTTSRTILTKYF